MSMVHHALFGFNYVIAIKYEFISDKNVSNYFSNFLASTPLGYIYPCSSRFLYWHCWQSWSDPWCLDMELLPALLTLCEENPPVTVDSPHKGSNTELWCYLWYLPEHTFEQASEFPVILDGMMLMWCHCDNNAWTCERYGKDKATKL